METICPKDLIRSNAVLVQEAHFGTRFVQLVVVAPAQGIYKRQRQ